MATKKQIFKTLWIIIIIIALLSVTALIVMPYWKGIFLAGAGGFLILNLFISMFFIQNNFRNNK